MIVIAIMTKVTENFHLDLNYCLLCGFNATNDHFIPNIKSTIFNKFQNH